MYVFQCRLKVLRITLVVNLKAGVILYKNLTLCQNEGNLDL